MLPIEVGRVPYATRVVRYAAPFRSCKCAFEFFANKLCMAASAPNVMFVNALADHFQSCLGRNACELVRFSRSADAARHTRYTRVTLRHAAETFHTPSSRALHETRDFPRPLVISY